MQCYKCHTEIKLDHKPTRQETCPKCLAYLHCCMNCRFYDPNVHNQCREPQAEWVKDKEMANFCDYFDPSTQLRTDESKRREEALKKLNELFKKK
ncbi:MAG: hypothetical protein D6813_07660 [Calditrichaeota bacterium]|nr:MAG: hypothetical protein D6813_07660 [Calditrichota bacterium]